VSPVRSARARLRRRIAAAGGVLIVAFAVSSIYDVWRAYHQSVAATGHELTTLSRALAAEAASGFQAVDVLLRDIAHWYKLNAGRTSPEHAQERLAIFASGLPQVRALGAVDAQGLLRFSWSASLLPIDEGSDLQHLIALPDGESSPRLSGLLASGVGRSAHLVLSRRVEEDAGLLGTVSALVDLDAFERFYRAIGVGEGNSIALLRDDGLLIAQEPPVLQAIGNRFFELAAPSVAEDPHEQNVMLMSSPIGGERRFVAVSKARDYPFVVMVTRTESVALAPWSGQTVHVAMRTLALSLLGALVLAALVRQLARVEATEAEKQRLEGELRQSQKMEAIGTLAGGIAHDFNNILGAILGYGELAQKNLAEGGSARRHLDQVMRAGARAKGLVQRILAFSRSALGERAPVHMQSMVEEALDLLSASLPAGVRLESKLDAGDTAVVGEATQLHQLVMNLCTNAVQAMANGGILRVMLDRVALPERRLLSHGTLKPAEYVRLSVSDTGSGIPPAVLERMFDPFFTTKRVGDGTGLGLALVHGIVADFGGAIDVATQAGTGTTFTVWLPAAGETPRPLAEPAGELPHGNGETVMIVDDEHALRALAEETLAALGYEPAGFDSSLAALEAFRAEPRRYDLVLTDETMPDLSGIELASEIRRVRPELPIVLMSGYSGAQLTERARAAGVAELLRKPLVARDIAEALSAALRRSR
jgi:signal transduction histidine kinase/ActR/RegA family two-component response regulator